MERTSTVSQISIRLRGKRIPGAEDRQNKIPGFKQAILSASKVLCIGAGGLISHIAPALVRKGIGALTILDDDFVEVSNLNRQRFYEKDLGQNKAIALAQNLRAECIHDSLLTGYALSFQQAVDRGIDLSCNVAICGVDNNPTRVAASRCGISNRSKPLGWPNVSDTQRALLWSSRESKDGRAFAHEFVQHEVVLGEAFDTEAQVDEPPQLRRLYEQVREGRDSEILKEVLCADERDNCPQAQERAQEPKIVGRSFPAERLRSRCPLEDQGPFDACQP